MRNTNDQAKEFFLTALTRTDGDLPSLELAWLAGEGYTTGTLDERWRRYAAANAIAQHNVFKIRDAVVYA